MTKATIVQRPKRNLFPLRTLLLKLGKVGAGKVRRSKKNSLDCTLLARWDEGYSQPWLIVTDLDPHKAEIWLVCNAQLDGMSVF